MKNYDWNVKKLFNLFDKNVFKGRKYLLISFSEKKFRIIYFNN